MRRVLTTKLFLITVIIMGWLAMSGAVYALPMADLVYQETDIGGGQWQYDYTLFNLSGPGYNLYDVFFLVDSSVTMSIEAFAPDWDGFGGAGFGEIFSLDPGSDILPGASLGGFRFIFDSRVGNIFFEALFTEPTGLEAPLIVPGVTAPAGAPVPEPSTLLMVGAGLSGLWFLKRRR